MFIILLYDTRVVIVGGSSGRSMHKEARSRKLESVEIRRQHDNIYIKYVIMLHQNFVHIMWMLFSKQVPHNTIIYFNVMLELTEVDYLFLQQLSSYYNLLSLKPTSYIILN